MLEATLTFSLWSMRLTKEDTGWGMKHLCLWNQSILDWKGMNTSNPLYEKVRGDEVLEMTEEEKQQLKDARKENRKRKIKKRIESGQRKMDNHTVDERAEYNRKRNARRARFVEKNRGKIRCETCNMQFVSEFRLGKHNKTQSHRQKAGLIPPPEGNFRCDICSRDFTQYHGLRRHYDAKSHLAMVEKASRVGAGGGEGGGV